MKYIIGIGISKFRVQSDGSPLPNARSVTLIVFKNVSNISSYKINEILVPWGQFVAHDMSYSALNSINSTFPGKYYYNFVNNLNLCH